MNTNVRVEYCEYGDVEFVDSGENATLIMIKVGWASDKAWEETCFEVPFRLWRVECAAIHNLVMSSNRPCFWNVVEMIRSGALFEKCR